MRKEDIAGWVIIGVTLVAIIILFGWLLQLL